MNLSPSRQKIRGFTMMEVLIAVAILGFIITAVYSSWSSILRAAKIGNDTTAAVQRSRIALHALEEAFTTAQMFNENIVHYAFETTADSDFSAVSMISRLSPTFPGSGQFGQQAVRRVTFRVRPGTNGNELVMQQIPMLMVTNTGYEIYELVLARHVQEFLLEYWDNRIDDWSTEWLYTNQLPRLVRVSLETAASDQGKARDATTLFTTIVSIAATNITVNLQMASPATGQPGGPGAGGGGGGIGGGGGAGRPGRLNPGAPGSGSAPSGGGIRR